MENINDIEKIQLQREIEDSINFIDYNLSVFDVIVDDVMLDKELPKALSYLRKTIFDYILSNDKFSISSDIFIIDKIISDTYASFSDILISDTYSSNNYVMDKIDNKYFLDLIKNAVSKVDATINKSDIKISDIDRNDIRINYLRKELNNIVMKLKMMGIISYDISMEKINEVINYVSLNYYDLHLSIIEPLFIENIRNIDNVLYDRYDIEMEKIYLYATVNKIQNNMYAYLEEDLEDEMQEIKDIIHNVSSFDSIDDISIILNYLDNIEFIRYEYPSVDIWKKMILELLSMVVNLMKGLFKDNKKDELIILKEMYFNLKEKYFKMIFIGNSRDTIDIEKTERENLILVRK